MLVQRFFECFGALPRIILQADVKTAFLHGDLAQPIYLELPIAHVQKQGKNKVWMTDTAVYSLLEGANAWFNKLKSTLLTPKFT